MRESYIYIYGTSVTLAPPYTKPIGRMKYLAMISPRQEKSIANHVDVCDRDQASHRYRFNEQLRAVGRYLRTWVLRLAMG